MVNGFTEVLVYLAMLTPPPTTLDDLRRFPDHEAATAACNYNRKHASHVKLRLYWLLSANDRFDLMRHEEEVEWLHSAWCALWEGTNRNRDETMRLWQLNVLRGMIGEESWAAGQMPPSVPWWRFRP